MLDGIQLIDPRHCHMNNIRSGFRGIRQLALRMRLTSDFSSMLVRAKDQL
jgi:hypothetical protein